MSTCEKPLEDRAQHGVERLPIYTEVLVPSFQTITKAVSAHLWFYQLVHLPRRESLNDKANEVSIIYLPQERKELKLSMAYHLEA